ncbi:hypothetical protein PTKIN_Ptkin12aG0051800 [Pterospermum kingtungense]
MPNHLLLLPLLLSAVLAAADDDGAAILKIASSFRSAPSGWSNSTSSANYCNWPGISCDDSSRVISINLASKSLSGTLAPEIATLSQLSSVSLEGNSLSGAIPSFAKLTNLKSIYLDGNAFTSVSPDAFLGLSKLQTLSLSDNGNLSPWTFPDFSQSTDLGEVQVENTSLFGTLPDVFANLKSLQSLRLSYNNFSGTLPASLGSSKIQNFWINHQADGFEGTLEVLSSMTQLTQAWLHQNMFTGPIPDLSNCTIIFDLQLRGNQLTGPVPQSLINLPSLKNVSLSNNKLQGPFPKFPSSIEKVVVTGTNNFCTDDGDPCDPQVATFLEIAGGFGYPVFLSDDWNGNDACKWPFITCDAQGNAITVNLAKKGLVGMISPAFGNLTYLKNLILNDNNLTGPIPDALNKLNNLQLLDVSNNSLTGDIPKFSSSVTFTYSGNSLLGKSSASGGSSVLAKKKKGGSSGSSIAIIAAGSTVAAAIAIVVVCFIRLNISRSKEESTQSRNAIHLWQGKMNNARPVEAFIKKFGTSLAPKRYSYADIKKMTNKFKDKLGRGGYGSVYKGKLPNGQLVAVKVLSESKGNGEEFMNEVASISRTSHVNIVTLLGFCYDKSRRALIYEFMSHGSLDKFIYSQGSQDQGRQLEWKTLHDIALGIAKGLEYLHQGCNTRILHFDIKPHNILLDENFCPKISDFGLSKLCERKESIISMTGARGTAGYIAPEVFCRNFGGVSHKSDVYSYGMMVLEMVGGRKNIDAEVSKTSEIYFPSWIYKHLDQDMNLSLHGVTEEDEEEVIRKMIVVSLWCIQTNPLDRPSMNKVLEMLQGSLESLVIPPRPFLSSPVRSPGTASST